MSIVVIDPVSSGIAYIHAAVEMEVDLHVLCLDEGERKVSPELRNLVKSVVKVDSRDIESLISAIENIGDVQAILPGSEYTVPVCSQLAKHFLLPGLNRDTVAFVRDKYAFRNKIKEQKLSHIRYFLVDINTDLQALNVPMEFDFPAVIKPVDMSGSIEVKRIDSFDDLVSFMLNLSQREISDLDYISSGKFIVEEYIPGDEFSVEGVVIDDKIEILSITEKILGEEPYFVELGHIVGNQLCETISNRISQYAKFIVQAIGINIGPFHLELRVRPDGQPVAIEIAARMPGDKIVELIKQSSGIDLAQMTIAAYVNKKMSKEPCSNGISAISFIFRGRKERFTELNSIDKYKNHKYFKNCEIYFNRGDMLGSNQDWTSRIGHFIFFGDNYHEIKDVAYELNRKVGLI
ncbi:ATP-grasp domain-containing protein [Vibrio sp. MEBiC08052]|uniref:ATP-grasp domain-containing protein n=1 Tax=Vibrio sp. MEBiC08052 TaxID=1761910 RepID=UPI0007407395|nr:ATP-grasp domain-containing protein [Vibrio sp. MEBiC08052]KUJ00685.1 hypothetical protein VRK_01870 [Vibrio sp. MEBiC08052]